jgi:hypothetical protein
MVEHSDLHTNATIRSALTNTFAFVSENPRPYLARMIGLHDLEHEEQTSIDGGALPTLGRWYVAHQ